MGKQDGIVVRVKLLSRIGEGILLGSQDGDIVKVALGSKVGSIEGLLVNEGTVEGFSVGKTLTGSAVGFAIGANEIGGRHCGGFFGEH